MNKSTHFCANKTQIATTLSEIGIYNQRVKENLSNKNLSPLLSRAVEIFHEQRKREKISIEAYNGLVADFNKRNGFVLLKKGSEFSTGLSPKKYNYINYPYLDSVACAITMDNYRAYRHRYNKEAQQANKAIRDYNDSVVKMYPLLTNEEKAVVKEFEKNNNSLFVTTYNALVDEKNAKNPIFRKKRIQTIKLSTETVFFVLVGFYVSQLKSHNGYLLEMNRSTRVLSTALPKIKIDQRKLANHKLKNVPRLEICKKTAQNHVKRLLESGILVHYTYINQNKPIAVNFNAEILHILDGNPPKSKNAENKSFTASNEHVLLDDKEITRTKLKEKERKDFAKSKGLRKCGSILEGIVSDRNFYKNTKGMKNISIPGEPRNKSALLTKNFKKKLLDDREFAKRLKRGDYDKYTNLSYDYLIKIMQYAHISTEEYREIILQDFIKTSSKIWKNHEVYEGEWKNVINALKVNLFKYSPNKEVVLKKLREYRWKINWARKWFCNHKDINALFPNDYFNPTRTTKQEVGFAGIHPQWLKHLRKEKLAVAAKKAQIHEGNERKRRLQDKKKKLSAQKKITIAIKKYENGQYDYKQLYSYVQDNLPYDYLILLPNMIKNENTNLA